MAEAKFKFILGRRKNYPLHLELEVYKGANCRVFITTGIVLESERQWDAARQLIIKSKNDAQYNKFLQQMVQNVKTVEADVERHGGVLTPDAIKLAANSQTARGEDVFETFNRYISEMKNIKESTRDGQYGYVRMLQRYVRQIKGNKNATLFFGEVSLNLIKGVDQYMFERVRPGYTSSFHYCIRKLLRRAKKEGLIGGTPYDNFEVIFYPNGNRLSLTTDQFRMIEDIDRSVLPQHNIYEQVLDMFLFSCYTGLRYSDVSTLKKEHVSKDPHGIVIHKKTIKTGIDVTLPLYSLFSGKPQHIIEKYIHDEDRDLVFPYISKDIIDKQLHRVEKLVNIPIPLTFHVGRHTCASQLAERVDNPFVIMSVLGHGKIETSMHYIHTSHKTAEKKLEKVKWEEELTPEEITQEDNTMEKVCNDIREACQRKKLSDTLTRFTLGIASCNLDKGQLISEWIGKIRKTDYTIEAWGKRLEMLVG